MAAFKAAVSSGLSPVEFWELTPYLTGLAVGGAVDKQTTDAWLNANYVRAKNLPELTSLLVLGKVGKKEGDMNNLKDHLKNIGARK